MTATPTPPANNAPAAPAGGSTPLEANNFDPVVNPHGSDVEAFFKGLENNTPAPEPEKPANKPADKPANTPAPSADPEAIGVDDILNLDNKKTQKPATPPTPEPTPEINIDEIPEPAKDSKARAGWDTLKNLAKEERAKRAELDARLKELQEKNVDKTVVEKMQARLTEVEKERNEFSEKMKILDIQSHPEYVEKYVKPQQAALASIQKTITEAAVEGFDLTAFQAATPKEQREMLASILPSLDPITQQDLVADYKRLSSAVAGAKEALTNSTKTAEEFRSKLNASQKQIFDEVKSSYKSRFHPIPVPEGAAAEEVARIEAYNRELQEVVTRAETTALKTTSMADMARAAIDASMLQFVLGRGLPRIQEVYSREIKTRDTKIAELTAQVNAMKKAAPSFSPGSSGDGDGVVGTVSEMSHADAVKAAFRG